MHLDARGLPISTASVKAAGAFDHLVTGYLTYRADTPARLTAVLEADPNLPGEMQTTVTLRQVSCGTELIVVQEGVPDAIPLEMCYLGWQESLAQLATLVEPEIPA